MALTTLGALRVGQSVHLERPLRMGDPLGGHLVAGHVDGVGRVVERREVGTSLELEVSAPPAIARTLVAKGSVTIDGASLTVNVVTGDTFGVTLIPHTLSVTNLGRKPIGSPVNLESDLVAKHIDRLVTAHLATSSPSSSPTPLSLDTLRKHGFAR
jgi:riboflavin synthase